LKFFPPEKTQGILTFGKYRENTGNFNIWKNTEKTQGILTFGKIQRKHREF